MSARFFEPLETRQLMSVSLVSGLLQINGTDGADNITLHVAEGSLQVSDNGVVSSFAAGDVRQITVSAKGGNDSVLADSSVNVPMTLNGDAGNDTLRGGSVGDEIWGGAGFDEVRYDDRTDGVRVTLDGLANDGRPPRIFRVFGTPQFISPGERDNVHSDVEAVCGGKGNDTLTGHDGDNALYGLEGDDQLNGLGGGDRLFGGSGADAISGGEGWDEVHYDEPQTARTGGVRVTLDGVANDGTPLRTIRFMGTLNVISPGELDNVQTDVESIWGTNLNDTLIGNDGNNALFGLEGDDQLFGRGGNDQLFGYFGNDQLNGETGNDSLWGEAGADVLSGGEDRDEVRYDETVNARTKGVRVTIDGLANDGTPGTTIPGPFGGEGTYLPGERDNVMMDVETVWGTRNNDTITGSGGDNALFGIEGDDQLWGYGGNDKLFGFTGNDSLYGEGGRDSLWGEAGSDLLSGGSDVDEVRYDETVNARAWGVNVSLDGLANDGAPRIRLPPRNGRPAATILAENDNVQTDVEAVYGTKWGDRLTGNDGNNSLYGLDGDDLIYALGGHDVLAGGSGNDRLYAGTGTNWLYGEAGNDHLISVGGDLDQVWGGRGYDSFWADPDEVRDVESAEVAAGSLHEIGQFSNLLFRNFQWVGDRYDWVSSKVPKDPLGQSLPDPALTAAATNYTNISGLPLFGFNGPGRNDINQNQVGDCYFLATLSGIADKNPDRIRQAITDLGDGTYAVRFVYDLFGAQPVYIRVDGDVGANGTAAAYAGFSRTIGTWAAIMEKAYAYFRTGFLQVNPSYANVAGGNPQWPMINLGLKGVETNDDYASPNDLWNWIDARLRQGKVVTYSTTRNPPAQLVRLHVYTVVGTFIDGAGNRMIIMRNPWSTDGGTWPGGGDGNNDGYITISAATALAGESDLAACWA